MSTNKLALEILNKHINFCKDGIIERDSAIKAMEQYHERRSLNSQDLKNELSKFIEWYWREVHGKPCDYRASDIVNAYGK